CGKSHAGVKAGLSSGHRLDALAESGSRFPGTMNAAEPHRQNPPGQAAIPVHRRRVVYLAGFDPTPPETLARYTASGLRKFGALWDAEATAGAPTLSDDAMEMNWHVTVRGRNWTTETHYTVLRWDDLMAPYVQRSWIGRVLSGYGALLRLAAEGMFVRYFRANFRYGLFVLYPFLLLGGAILLARLIAGAAGRLGVPSPEIAVPLVGIAAFILLFRLVGAYFHIQFALADWRFALDLMNRRVAGLDACIARFAPVLKQAARAPGADEVLVAATSMGAVLLAETLEKALAEDPDLCRRAPRFAMLTVGSSIMKIGLHPSATDLRAAVARIGREKSLFWVEYQAKVDFINFYKNDPVAEL